MIIATLKPLDELVRCILPYHRILVAGCHTCVTVGGVGGEENVRITVAAVEMAAHVRGRSIRLEIIRLARQCEPEFLELAPELQESGHWDAILSFGCASGVQALRDARPDLPVIPALNTRFIGAPVGGSGGRDVWESRCVGCGDCFLHLTGDICVLARCPRGMQNGSCGFESETGKCDVNPKLECVWDIIRARYHPSGTRNGGFVPARNWSFSCRGGCTRIRANRFHDASEDSS
ncbi:MAG TPA: methylenetetrahydrofolate reductase C-terminal domain-containing protein [bacterium]|nr:methylenetetrahydrofolate reductase C-terminal domain-containing protein [bacterium]